MSLDDVLIKLSSNDGIDAVLLCGSTASGTMTKASDYDLAIVAKDKPEKLTSMFAYIDGAPSDLFFYSSEEIRRILEAKKADEGAQTWLMHWLKKGKIAFDKSGALTELQRCRDGIELPSDEPGAERLAYKINYNLVNNARYFGSGDLSYLAALEIRLMYSIVEALVGYLAFRHVYWEGEKAAIAYLREHDPGYLKLFEAASRSPDIAGKFEAYKELAERTFTERYAKWGRGAVASIEGDYSSFWHELLS
ncbi:MAG: nucleotidyltransferase domain-containing protein [Patescibacteria group bacterium]|nr:nucleotidyltransferase domain-containing protein [Patescibacteria group bacterium]